MFKLLTTSFGGDRDFDHIVMRSISMLGDARHSFDLASVALLTRADVAAVAADVRGTDERINLAEQELRSELVVHVSVQGGADIGSVLGFTLLLKKIERIGDQAKNILDLAESGVVLADGPDIDVLREERNTVSTMFVEAASLLGDPDVRDDDVEEFARRVDTLSGELRARIDGYMTSDRRADEIVPRAFYTRYLLRIVANLLGVVRSAIEPIYRTELDQSIDDLDD